jgi:hypothetical protein
MQNNIPETDNPEARVAARGVLHDLMTKAGELSPSGQIRLFAIVHDWCATQIIYLEREGGTTSTGTGGGGSRVCGRDRK